MFFSALGRAQTPLRVTVILQRTKRGFSILPKPNFARSWRTLLMMNEWIEVFLWEKRFNLHPRSFKAIFFLVSLPAKMSCKLWLNVWTCRSFTCPFTLRNLDKNPTAAVISGFIVPRAQRVCIEKGHGDDPCAFVAVFFTYFSYGSSLRPVLSWGPCLLALLWCLLAFISRGRGKLTWKDGFSVEEIDARCW